MRTRTYYSDQLNEDFCKYIITEDEVIGKLMQILKMFLRV